MPALEREFYKTPEDWSNDLDRFRLGLVAWYIEMNLGIAYRDDQRNITSILYNDPNDLFLNGVMDSRRGTCGNMAMLHVAFGRRLGLPVSLACAGSHYFLRYDDGNKQINIESTPTGKGGFSVPTDEQVFKNHRLPQKAMDCGSDLRAVTHREMLGLFLGLRARHYENTNRLEEAEPDYLQARALFPRHRNLYYAQNQFSVQQSSELFEPGERGHPTELLSWLKDVCRVGPWIKGLPKGDYHVQSSQPFMSQVIVGGRLA